MTAVDFLMANSTVPEAWRPQVVKRRRHNADHRLRGGVLSRHIGVAFKTHVSHLLPRQHFRVSGAMNLMTTGTALQPDRRVLECKRASLVGMALETTRLVSGERPNLPEKKAAMWIMAIRTRHCALRQPVSVRALKLAPGAEMARGALLIDGYWFSHHQALALRLVHPVATQATHATSGMPALDPSYVSRLIQMARKARLISFRSPELRRVAYVLGRC
jgi:hypothetical protein